MPPIEISLLNFVLKVEIKLMWHFIILYKEIAHFDNFDCLRLDQRLGTRFPPPSTFRDLVRGWVSKNLFAINWVRLSIIYAMFSGGFLSRYHLSLLAPLENHHLTLPFTNSFPRYFPTPFVAHPSINVTYPPCNMPFTIQITRQQSCKHWIINFSYQCMNLPLSEHSKKW